MGIVSSLLKLASLALQFVHSTAVDYAAETKMAESKPLGACAIMGCGVIALRAVDQMCIVSPYSDKAVRV